MHLPRLKWGLPNGLMSLRTVTGWLHRLDGGRPCPYVVSHSVERWYGLTFGGRCFFGIMILDGRREGYALADVHPGGAPDAESCPSAGSRL